MGELAARHPEGQRRILTADCESLPREIQQYAQSLERFQREARAASALNHPNICTVHVIEQHRPQHFIVIDLLKGRTLGGMIGRQPFPMDQLLCAPAICRTPGFRGTHAGVEKDNQRHGTVNITQAVIDRAEGNCLDHTAADYLLICGQKIDSPDSHPADGTTDIDDAASSTEAMCVSVKGQQVLQLARQLTAAALNGLISGGGAACSGTAMHTTVFGECNTACASGTATKDRMTACIGELGCLNHGVSFDGGICVPGAPGNCHERPLVNDTLGLDFDPPGNAGSSRACNAAIATPCTVIGNSCGTDSLP